MSIMSLPASEPRLVYDASMEGLHLNAAVRLRDLIMATSINTLLNQLVPLKSTGSGLSPASQRAVIEAVVLSNSPLITTEGKPQTTVTLTDGQQRLELTAQTPIPVGAKVQLKMAANNLAVVLSINDRPTTPGSEQQSHTLNSAVRHSALPPTLPRAETTLQGQLKSPLLESDTQAQRNQQDTISPPQARPFEALRPLVEQTLRQSLPQQESLRTLLPVISEILANPRALPKELVITLTHFKNQFPTANQLQQSAPLKRAIRDSGTFFEVKLAQQILDKRAPQSKPAADQKPTNHPDTPINRDIKGLIERALPLIEKAIQKNTEAPQQGTLPPATSTKKPTKTPSNPEILNRLQQAFTLPPGAAMPASAHPVTKTEGGKPIDAGLDIVLRQLGRQLLATLAKTQVSQLESLVARNPAAADNPPPTNSWTLELPIIHGKQVDNLEVRIEEQAPDQQNNESNRKKQWVVTLNFDLHQLGKMQVQLTIVEQQVSAAVWSQLRQTHEQVRQSINELKQGLEKIGVTVRHVECHWGEAPKQSSILFQQLVDVHT